MFILLILLLVFIAIVWVVSEPISGILGSCLIAKVIAVIIAFKALSWILGGLMGPAVCSIPLQ